MATSLTIGTKMRHTQVCNFESDTVTKDTIIYGNLGKHVYTGGTATCTGKPVCSVCGDEYGSPKGHVVARDAAVDPTCTTTGLTEGAHCDVCGIYILNKYLLIRLSKK